MRKHQIFRKLLKNIYHIEYGNTVEHTNYLNECDIFDVDFSEVPLWALLLNDQRINQNAIGTMTFKVLP